MALRDPRDHLEHQVLVTMDVKVLRDHLDPRGPRGIPHFPDRTDPTTL